MVIYNDSQADRFSTYLPVSDMNLNWLRCLVSFVLRWFTILLAGSHLNK